MIATTTCPHWCECSHTGGQDELCRGGAMWASTPSVEGDDLDVTVAAGSIETSALGVYRNVERGANLPSARTREVARNLLEAASGVEDHSVG